jgi:uncharacterized membrane protein YtjA (UPF0391 family)
MEDGMLYYGLACLMIAIVTFTLGFTGVARGAALFANLALMASLALLAASGIAALGRRYLHHHH